MKTLKINNLEDAVKMVGKRVRAYDFPFGGEGDDEGSRATFIDGTVVGISSCSISYKETPMGDEPYEDMTAPETNPSSDIHCPHFAIRVEVDVIQGVDSAIDGLTNEWNRIGNLVFPPCFGGLGNGDSTVAPLPDLTDSDRDQLNERGCIDR